MQTKAARNMVQYFLVFLHLLRLVDLAVADLTRNVFPLPFSYLLPPSQIGLIAPNFLVVLPNTIFIFCHLLHLTLLLLSQSSKRSYFCFDAQVERRKLLTAELRRGGRQIVGELGSLPLGPDKVAALDLSPVPDGPPRPGLQQIFKKRPIVAFADVCLVDNFLRRLNHKFIAEIDR